MSWQVAAILFAILAFEGVRRLDSEDVILRCDPLGTWRVAVPLQLWRQWYLVSALPAFFLTVVVRRESSSKSLRDDRGHIRSLVRATEPVLSLRLLCALDFLVVVIGIPWGISRYGSAGLLAFIALPLALSAVIMIRSAAVLLSQGHSRWAAFRSSTSFLSPFASPFAAEAALSSLLENHSPIAVISTLLGEAEFAALMRPAAYDVESRQSETAGSLLGELARALPSNERMTILESAANGCTEFERFCPRCAERYSLESTACADCDGVQLRATR